MRACTNKPHLRQLSAPLQRGRIQMNTNEYNYLAKTVRKDKERRQREAGKLETTLKSVETKYGGNKPWYWKLWKSMAPQKDKAMQLGSPYFSLKCTNLTFYMAFSLTVSLPYLLALFQTFSLTFYLTFFLTYIFWHFISHCLTKMLILVLTIWDVLWGFVWFPFGLFVYLMFYLTLSTLYLTCMLYMYPNIYSGKQSDIESDILSDMFSGILSDVFADIFCRSVWHILCSCPASRRVLGSG